jgi:hypothetical protein
MTDTELRPHDRPAPVALHPSTWSRRRVLVVVCAGGALTAAGPISLIATSSDPEPVPHTTTRGRGTWTSFGSVALLFAARAARPDSAAHLHEGAAPAGGPLANRTWTTVVRVRLEVHNGSERPALLSPGQFRLRLGATGTTVSPYDVDRPPAAVPPAQTVQTWVTYLAPAEESELSLEYDDTGMARPLTFDLSLPALPAAAGAS